jgi:hypothetical protein
LLAGLLAVVLFAGLLVCCFAYWLACCLGVDVVAADGRIGAHSPVGSASLLAMILYWPTLRELLLVCRDTNLFPVESSEEGAGPGAVSPVNVSSSNSETRIDPRQLRAPHQLFDPRQPAFARLLDTAAVRVGALLLAYTSSSVRVCGQGKIVRERNFVCALSHIVDAAKHLRMHVLLP